MQGYSPADKSHLSLILALSREASGVKGQESIYLCNSFCQPAKKKGSRVVFFHFGTILGHPKHHYVDAKEMQKKSNIAEMKT